MSKKHPPGSISEGLVTTVVFEQGEDGCHMYRIPSLAKAQDGSLIALAEGRRDNKGDPGWGHIDVFYKRSFDSGRSWSRRIFFDRSQEGWSASNPTAVAECSTGRVHVLFNRWKPGQGGKNSRPGTFDNQLWMRYSDNHGESWSDAVDITRQGRDVEHWGKAVFGPGHGIETSCGRLVIPAYGGSCPEELAAFALYSDDGGQSWKRGKQVHMCTNENQIVELVDKRLLMDARQEKDLPGVGRLLVKIAEKAGANQNPGRL